MPRYKSYDYDQLLMVPVSLEDQLVPGTLEYAIHQIIEERIDTTIFDEKYRNDETGRSAYDPKVLLKIVLLAYSRGMLHSRPMERACKENVTFMALIDPTELWRNASPPFRQYRFSSPHC